MMIPNGTRPQRTSSISTQGVKRVCIRSPARTSNPIYDISIHKPDSNVELDEAITANRAVFVRSMRKRERERKAGEKRYIMLLLLPLSYVISILHLLCSLLRLSIG